MPAYVIAQVEVTDWERFATYIKETPHTITAYGGKYKARGGQTLMLEGEIEAKRNVLIEFPSTEMAKNWYNSEAYREVKALRAGAAAGSIIAIEGC